MKYFAVQTILPGEAIEVALKNQGNGKFRAEGAWQKAAEIAQHTVDEPLVLLICRPKSTVGVEWVALIQKVSYRADSSDILFSKLRPLNIPIPLSEFTRLKGRKPLSDRYPSSYAVCLFDETVSTMLKASLGDICKSPVTKVSSTTEVSYTRKAAEEELSNDPESKNLSVTARTLLIEARIGQGRYRADLIKLWGGRCSLTGCNILQVLIASHAKRWSDSSNDERLDPFNGLLLSAHVDKLFDSGLISFSDNGSFLVSDKVNDDSLAALGLSRNSSLRFVREKHLPYLAAHRARNDF